MTTLQQSINATIGVLSTLLIIGLILWGAFWLAEKFNKND